MNATEPCGKQWHLLTGLYDLFHFSGSVLRQKSSIPGLLSGVKGIRERFVRPQRPEHHPTRLDAPLQHPLQHPLQPSWSSHNPRSVAASPTLHCKVPVGSLFEASRVLNCGSCSYPNVVLRSFPTDVAFLPAFVDILLPSILPPSSVLLPSFTSLHHLASSVVILSSSRIAVPSVGINVRVCPQPSSAHPPHPLATHKIVANRQFSVHQQRTLRET